MFVTCVLESFAVFTRYASILQFDFIVEGLNISVFIVFLTLYFSISIYLFLIVSDLKCTEEERNLFRWIVLFSVYLIQTCRRTVFLCYRKLLYQTFHLNFTICLVLYWFSMHVVHQTKWAGFKCKTKWNWKYVCCVCLPIWCTTESFSFYMCNPLENVSTSNGSQQYYPSHPFFPRGQLAFTLCVIQFQLCGCKAMNLSPIYSNILIIYSNEIFYCCLCILPLECCVSVEFCIRIEGAIFIIIPKFKAFSLIHLCRMHNYSLEYRSPNSIESTTQQMEYSTMITLNFNKLTSSSIYNQCPDKCHGLFYSGHISGARPNWIIYFRNRIEDSLSFSILSSAFLYLTLYFFRFILN